MVGNPGTRILEWAEPGIVVVTRRSQCAPFVRPFEGQFGEMAMFTPIAPVPAIISAGMKE